MSWQQSRPFLETIVVQLLLTHELPVCQSRILYGRIHRELAFVEYPKNTNSLPSLSSPDTELQIQRDWCYQYWRSGVVSKVLYLLMTKCGLSNHRKKYSTQKTPGNTISWRNEEGWTLLSYVMSHRKLKLFMYVYKRKNQNELYNLVQKDVKYLGWLDDLVNSKLITALGTFCKIQSLLSGSNTSS